MNIPWTKRRRWERQAIALRLRQVFILRELFSFLPWWDGFPAREMFLGSRLDSTNVFTENENYTILLTSNSFYANFIILCRRRKTNSGESIYSENMKKKFGVIMMVSSVGGEKFLDGKWKQSKKVFFRSQIDENFSPTSRSKTVEKIFPWKWKEKTLRL